MIDKYQQRVASRIDYSTEEQDKLASESYSKLADSKLASAASKRHNYFELEPPGLQSSADRMSFKMETKETESVGGEDSIEGAGGCEGSVCSEGAEDYEVPIKGCSNDQRGVI